MQDIHQARALVARFNATFPIGSTVPLRKCSYPEYPYNPYLVQYPEQGEENEVPSMTEES